MNNPIKLAFKLPILSDWAQRVHKLRSEPGYLTPKLTMLNALATRTSFGVLGQLLVGEIEIIGRHRIPRHGRIILAPNHSHKGDGALASHAGRLRKLRYMVDVRTMESLLGWVGALDGAIAVDCRKEKKSARVKALRAAIKYCADEGPDSCLVCFGQGQYRPTIERADFESGIARIALEVAQAKDEPVYIVPLAIHYAKNGHKAIGVVGRPIKVTPLPVDKTDPDYDKLAHAYIESVMDEFVRRLKLSHKVAVWKETHRRCRRHS